MPGVWNNVKGTVQQQLCALGRNPTPRRGQHCCWRPRPTRWRTQYASKAAPSGRLWQGVRRFATTVTAAPCCRSAPARSTMRSPPQPPHSPSTPCGNCTVGPTTAESATGGPALEHARSAAPPVPATGHAPSRGSPPRPPTPVSQTDTQHATSRVVMRGWGSGTNTAIHRHVGEHGAPAALALASPTTPARTRAPGHPPLLAASSSFRAHRQALFDQPHQLSRLHQWPPPAPCPSPSPCWARRAVQRGPARSVERAPAAVLPHRRALHPPRVAPAHNTRTQGPRHTVRPKNTAPCCAYTRKRTRRRNTPQCACQGRVLPTSLGRRLQAAGLAARPAQGAPLRVG